MKFLASALEFIIGIWNYIHDKGQQKIGAQSQVIQDLKASQDEAIKTNKTNTKIEEMSSDQLNADLDKRMRD